MDKGDEKDILSLILLVIGMIIFSIISRIGFEQFANWLLWTIALLMSIYMVALFVKFKTIEDISYYRDKSSARIMLDRIFWWGIPIVIAFLLLDLFIITLDIFNTEVNYSIFPIVSGSILIPLGLGWFAAWRNCGILKKSLYISIMSNFIVIFFSIIFFGESISKLYLPSAEYESSIFVTLLTITLSSSLLSYGFTHLLIEKDWIYIEGDYQN